MTMKQTLGLVLILGLSAVAIAQVKPTPSPKGAEVYFIAPKDGETRRESGHRPLRPQGHGHRTGRYGLREQRTSSPHHRRDHPPLPELPSPQTRITCTSARVKPRPP